MHVVHRASWPLLAVPEGDTGWGSRRISREVHKIFRGNLDSPEKNKLHSADFMRHPTVKSDPRAHLAPQATKHFFSMVARSSRQAYPDQSGKVRNFRKSNFCSAPGGRDHMYYIHVYNYIYEWDYK